jgi:NTE family protein
MPAMKSKYNVGLALGGGGARGLAHIGVLKVLEREKIPVDLIVGTSMGAIIGAMYARYKNAEIVEQKVLEFLDEFLEKQPWLGVLYSSQREPKNSLFAELSNYVQRRYLGLKALTRISLEPKESLYEPLQNVLDSGNIENLKIPFAAVSLDILNGMPVVIDKGPIIEAVYASAAIEGVFPPLAYNGGLLADGGPVNMTPVEVAKDLGADRVIAVDVHQRIRKVEKFANGLEIIMRADNIGLDRLRLVDLAKADIVIAPSVATIHWANFAKARQCIRRGVQATEMMIPDIKKAIAGRRWLARMTNKIKLVFAEAPD